MTARRYSINRATAVRAPQWYFFSNKKKLRLVFFVYFQTVKKFGAGNGTQMLQRDKKRRNDNHVPPNLHADIGASNIRNCAQEALLDWAHK